MNEDAQKELYTDVVLELLTAYLFSGEEGNKQLTFDLMESVRKNPVTAGKGLMEGLVFSSVIHMALMISILGMVIDKSREEALQYYAMAYQFTRDAVAQMPQVHPDVVNQIVEKLDGLI